MEVKDLLNNDLHIEPVDAAKLHEYIALVKSTLMTLEKHFTVIVSKSKSKENI